MMNEKPEPVGILVYDSHCNLCLATKSWFEKRDSAGRVGFVSAHDSGLMTRFPQLQGLDLLGEITWIDEKGQTSRGADAIVSALQELPSWRLVAKLIMLPGTSTLRRLAYRWIAKHRYRWFGRTCDADSCQLHAPKAIKYSKPVWPTFFSLLVLVAVISPVLQNFRPEGKAKDDFPLSYYPMFSSKRQNLYEQASVIAVRRAGEKVPVHYKFLGAGGLNQNRRQLGKLLGAKKQEELRQYLTKVADRLASTSQKEYRGCVTVAAVKGTYDLNAYFTKRNQQPADMEMILEVKMDEATQHASN